MSQWLINVLLVVALVVIGAIPFAIYSSRKKKKKYDAAFGGREPLDEGIFYERYFKSLGVPFYVVIGVRKSLQEVLQDDLSQLSSKDDFTRNLSFFFEYDSMADVEIVEKLQEFRIKISDKEAGEAHTVEDIVLLVWNKVS